MARGSFDAAACSSSRRAPAMSPRSTRPRARLSASVTSGDRRRSLGSDPGQGHGRDLGAGVVSTAGLMTASGSGLGGTAASRGGGSAAILGVAEAVSAAGTIVFAGGGSDSALGGGENSRGRSRTGPMLDVVAGDRSTALTTTACGAAPGSGSTRVGARAAVGVGGAGAGAAPANFSRNAGRCLVEQKPTSRRTASANRGFAKARRCARER